MYEEKFESFFKGGVVLYWYTVQIGVMNDVKKKGFIVICVW